MPTPPRKKGAKASISADLFEELDELYREVRYQCFHHCRWKDRHGNPVGPNRGRGHLPLDDDAPLTHRGGCGFDAIGKRLAALRDASSNAEVSRGDGSASQPHQKS